jgi:hypothetical protein
MLRRYHGASTHAYDFAARIFIEARVEESSGKLTAKEVWLASLGGVDYHVRQVDRSALS